jgi:hypothetical protein
MEKIQSENIKYIMERSCLSKRSYNQYSADRAIETAATQGRLFYYYKCQFCNSFHLTSKEPVTIKHLEVV